VGVVPWRAVKEIRASLDGQALTRSDGQGPGAAPDRPASFAVPAGAQRGTLVLTADGQEILHRAFPLEIPDDTSGHEKIRAGLKASREMFADQRDRNWGVSGAREAAGGYPAGSTDRGRVLYRLGQTDDALACLTNAVAANAADGEAFHLLGVTLLEKGKTNEAASAFASAVAARNPYPAARYYRAVLALTRQDEAAARQELALLRQAIPEHWEARLLAAYVNGTVDEARQIEAEDPADPRAALVLAAAAKKAGDGRAAADAQAALDSLLKEPGAPARLAEFEALAQGRYLAPQRLGVTSGRTR
jgi:Flp pilus assembly protein TadD